MRQSTVALLVVLACTLLAAWFFTTHEKVSRNRYTGYRGEARVNDFLAADMLLNELGIDADSRPSLTPSDWLPANNDTLVGRLSTPIAVGVERDLLMAWVVNGGHLILMPPRQESRVFDDFFDVLGFDLAEVETNFDDDSAEGRVQDDGSDSFAYSVNLTNTRHRIEIHEEATFDATLSDDKGVIAARTVWGNGFVTMIASSRYFASRALDDSDHARLLMDVIAGYVEPGEVWFIYDATFPSLWQLIWDKAPYVVISFAIILFFWLWSRMPQFGPPISSQPAERRSIMEHVSAAGHFEWRNHGAKDLATSSTAAVMHEAESRHPGINRLSLQAQAGQIAKMTGLPAQEILDVLANRDRPRPWEFTHNMQALQRIRKKL